MVSKVRRPAVRSNVSYELLERFSDLLICSRCFRQSTRRAIPQVLSARHKPLAVCHDCSSEILSRHKAHVLKLN